MMTIGRITAAMIDYLKGDIHAIEHFLKVHGYARAIGEMEGLDERTLRILEVASVVHDIGIPRAMEVYKSSAGPYQEELGAVEALKLLRENDCEEEIIERVCHLVGHHHSYKMVDGADYQILLEADFLVNAANESLPCEAILKARESFFHTETGLHFLDAILLK